MVRKALLILATVVALSLCSAAALAATPTPDEFMSASTSLKGPRAAAYP